MLGLHMGDVVAVYVSGWTDGDPDTTPAVPVVIHTAARGLVAELEDHTHDNEARCDVPAATP